MTGAGLWLHAVVRDLDPARLVGLTGVGGQAVRPVPAGGLTAVVGPVDLAEFGEEPLRRNLEDLTWLEAVARTHHRVAEELFRHGPVIPARLATIYRDEDSVAELLTRRGGDLAAALDRVAGRLEWGVKIYAAPPPALPRPSPGTADRQPGAGAAYLRRRREALSAGAEAVRAAVESAEELHEVLVADAEAALRHPPQPRSLNSRAGSMVLNGTYLVDARQGGRFADRVTEHAGRYAAIEVELTGPWPPYSFATVPAAEGVDDGAH